MYVFRDFCGQKKSQNYLPDDLLALYRCQKHKNKMSLGHYQIIYKGLDAIKPSVLSMKDKKVEA